MSERKVDGPVSERKVDGPVSERKVDGPVASARWKAGPVSERKAGEPANAAAAGGAGRTDPQSADERLREFARAIDAPAFIVPFLDRFYEPADVELVLAAARGALLAGGSLLGTRGSLTVDRAVRRAILERAGDELRPPTFTHATSSGRCSKTGATSRPRSAGS